MNVDLAKITEVFVDATYNTSKTNTHLYVVIADESGYGVPLAFMLMEIHDKENTKTTTHRGEAKECNHNFYSFLKEMGLKRVKFVHTDKDFSEISAA